MVKLTKILIILFVLVLQSSRQTVFCQKRSVGISGVVTLQVSERWTALAEVHGNLEHLTINSHWGALACGVKFKMYDGIELFGRGTLSAAEYHGADDREHIMTLLEGVKFDTKSGFEHYLYVDQRRLKYKPANMSINCSRFGYTLMYGIETKSGGWRFVPQAACVLNLKSDVASAPVLQRMKFNFSAERRMSESMRVGVKLGWMVGSKEQVYMGDCHNLHTISVFVGWGNRP